MYIPFIKVIYFTPFWLHCVYFLLHQPYQNIHYPSPKGVKIIQLQLLQNHVSKIDENQIEYAFEDVTLHKAHKSSLIHMLVCNYDSQYPPY